MKKRSLLALVLSFAIILSVCTCAFGGLVASAETTVPAFDSAKYTDITLTSGLVSGNDYVGVTFDATNGSTLWTDVNSSGYRNVVNFEESALLGADTVYGTGTLKYVSSTYAANAAYHYVYLPIAYVTMNDTAGYLAFVFRGNNVAGTLSFVTGSGTGTAATDLVTLSSVTTAVGGSHAIQYAIDLANGTLTAIIDSAVVLDTVALPNGITLNNVTTGLGSLYAKPNLTGYRVYVNTPAELLAPEYDSAKHLDLTGSIGLGATTNGNWSYDSSTGASLINDVTSSHQGTYANDISNYLGDSTTIYASGTVKYKSNAASTNAYLQGPYIPLARMTLTYNSGTVKTGYLVILFPGENPHGSAYTTRLSFLRDDAIVSPDFASFGISNPSGGTHDYSYSLDTATNKLNVFIDGTKVLSDYVINSYSNCQSFVVDSYSAGFGYFYGSGDFTNARIYTDKPAAPEIDEESQKEILSFVSTGLKNNTTIERYDYSKYINDSTAVYTSVIADMAVSYGTYDGPFVALAETDYKASETDTLTYYWGLRLTDVSGWTFGLFSETPSGGIVSGYYIDYNNPYSNGSNSIPTDGVNIVSKVAGNKISLWVDGELILNEWTHSTVNVVSPVLGLCTLSDYAQVSMAQVSVWVDNDSYGYLGDLNGDMGINILDYILANKLSANTEGVTAFNDNVKAFNDEGTVGTSELIQMKKYLLGIIDSFEAASEYGEDTTTAEDLL